MPRALGFQGCGHATRLAAWYLRTLRTTGFHYRYSKEVRFRDIAIGGLVMGEADGERGGVIGGLPGHACRYAAGRLQTRAFICALVKLLAERTPTFKSSHGRRM